MIEFLQQFLSAIQTWWQSQSSEDVLWHAFGLLAQAMFFSRWLVQWIVSERAKKSVVPVMFWFFSFIGGIMMLVYVTYLGSPALIIGQAIGLIVYSRNIYFIWSHKNTQADEMAKVPAE